MIGYSAIFKSSQEIVSTISFTPHEIALIVLVSDINTIQYIIKYYNHHFYTIVLVPKKSWESIFSALPRYVKIKISAFGFVEHALENSVIIFTIFGMITRLGTPSSSRSSLWSSCCSCWGSSSRDC